MQLTIESTYGGLIRKLTLYVALVLHIYQPPTQKPVILKQICRESYAPLVNLHLEKEEAKITLNINGSLTELLNFYQEEEILSGIQQLAQINQIELLGSSCYHAILPLIPPKEINRQIELNTKMQQNILGKSLFHPKGFWLPEMAYEYRVINSLISKGFEWTILSSIACPIETLPDNFIPKINSNFKVFFRNDLLSNLISFNTPSPEVFFEEMKGEKSPEEEDYYLILAMDGETFGHHIKGLIGDFLEPLYQLIENDRNIELVTVSDLLSKFDEERSVIPIPSSWSTEAADLIKGVPFPLWSDPQNRIHHLQLTIMNHAIYLVGVAQRSYECSEESKTRFHNARKSLDKALHSCQLWWASSRPWYSSEMILKGLNQLLLASAEAVKVILWNCDKGEEKKKAMAIFDEIFQAQKELYLTV
ncbi:MAG: hypothetical protein GF308_11915 [Candidatus Heimdallarchaeota archaeon]|nr:hypothetical protein [Candidatus Heimdallarchaeota archaeon]